MIRGLVVWLSVACGCEAVPTLTFETPDGAADAGLDATGDSGDGGCSSAVPPQAAYTCCGDLVCEGPCAGQCDACQSKCTAPDQICCAKSNNVVCMAAGTDCH